MNKSIFFVIGQIGRGGAEKQLLSLAQELISQGLEVKVFVWSPNAKTDMFQAFQNVLGEDLILLTTKNLLVRFINLLAMIRKNRPDTLVSFTNYTNLIVFLSSIVTWRHSFGSIRNSLYVKKSFLKKIKSAITTFSPKLISNNKQSISYLNQNFPYLKTFFLPNSVQVELSDSKRSNIKFDSISIGSIKKEKRIDRLIDFVFEISKWNPNYKHIHLGGGILMPSFLKNVSERNMEENLIFMGDVSDVHEYINQSSLLLHFSDFEGTPNVVMEAMANRKAVVTTNCGDVKELIESDVNGFVIDNYSLDEFLLRVKQCLSDRDYLKQLGENSYSKIKEFSVENTASKFLEIVQ